MAGETNIDTGIFKPVDDDYAVITLERVFGPIVRAIADGTGIGNSGDAASMLVQLITLLNLAILTFAAVVLIYMVYSSIMDTASDGKLMGQSTDARYTVLRSAAGVVLLLPVKGGFTIIQVVVIYLLVWGSGLADTAWSRVASENLNGVSFTAPSSKVGEGSQSLSPMTTRYFAEAFRVRTQGYLCANYLNNASQTLNLGATIKPVSGQKTTIISDSTGKSANYGWYFEDNGSSYGSAQNLCGSVKILTYEYTEPSQIENGWLQSVSGSDVMKFTNTFNYTTRLAAINAEVSAMQLADSYAKAFADKIINNTRDTKGDRDLIQNNVSEILKAYATSFKSNINSLQDQQEYSKKLLELATKNGWIFAANWQRMMSSIYIKVKSALESVAIGTASPATPEVIFGIGYGSAGSETAAFFQELREQNTYFDSLASAFDAAATNKDAATIGQTEFENGTQIASWLADTVTNLMGRSDIASNIWSDPLVEIQDMGTVILTAAGAAKVGTTLASMAPNPAMSAVDSFLGPLATAMMVIGILLAIIVPFMPIIYYVGAVIGWAILAVEAIFAAPITVIMLFAPQRQANLVGSNHNVILTLFGVLLRPFFIVTGLIASYILIRVGIDVINVLFTGIVAVMAPEGSISSIYLFLGSVFIYGLVVVTTVMHCCGLITGLSDYVLGWIGVGMSSLVKANPMQSAQDTLGINHRIPAMKGVPELGGRIKEHRKATATYLEGKNSSPGGRQSRLPQ